MEGHGNLGELCGLAVPWARRGGEETDRWGQAASETRRPGERSTAGADVWVRVRRERGRGAGRASGLLREGGGGRWAGGARGGRRAGLAGCGPVRGERGKRGKRAADPLGWPAG